MSAQNDPLQPGPIWLECYDDDGNRYLQPGWLSWQGCKHGRNIRLDELSPNEAKWAGTGDHDQAWASNDN